MSDRAHIAEKPQRPLSPHLSIYKPQLTSVLSIMHRATGVALTAGTVLVAWWLIAAATGEDAYNTVRAVTGSPLGLLILFGWSVALFYHTCNGIRHLFWDMGYFLTIENAYKAGYAVLVGTLILTTGTWLYVYAKAQDAPKKPAITQQLAETMIDLQIQEDKTP